MRPIAALVSRLLPALFLASTALAAPGGTFGDGDLYVVSSSLPGNPNPFAPIQGVLRIDPFSGATQLILQPNQLGSRLAIFDPFRQKLVMGAQLTSGGPALVYLIDADGSATPTAIPFSALYASSAGDGRIFFLQGNGTATSAVRWLDAANAVHDVLDVAGTAPLTYTATQTITDVYYEPSTHSFWIATLDSATTCGWSSGVVGVIDRIPLNAAGTQAVGPVQRFSTCLPVPVPGFSSLYTITNLSAGPNGTVFYTVNTNGAPQPFPQMATIDPATMASTVWSTLAYASVITSGTYSHALGGGVVLDTFNDQLRAFPQGFGGGGLLVEDGAVSSPGGSSEVTKILEVTGSTTGLASFGTGTPGCNGPQVLTANQPAKVGAADFRFLCTNAPASQLGLLLVANVPNGPGADPFGLGILLHLDLFTSTVLLPLDMQSNALGLGSSAPIPLAPSFAGATLDAQAIWFWASCSPPSGTGLSSSNGLAFTILP